MNEGMESRITESFGVLMEYVEKGAGFVAEQSPLVVQEIITWGIVENLATGIVLAIAGFALWYSVNAFTHACVKPENERGYTPWSALEARGVSTIVGVLSVILFGLLALDQLRGAAKAYFAPRLYVLDVIGGML